MSISLILLSVVSALLLFGAAHRVLDRMQLTDRAALVIAALIFFGGLIPDIRLENVVFNIGGAVTPIALSISVNGESRQTSRAIFTPAAVDTYGNVTSTAIITVPKGCCFNVAVRYVVADEDPATTPTPVINLQNANLVINRVA